MQLSYEGEQAVRHVQSPADNAGQLTALESLLEAVRTHCEVRTADGHPNVLDGQHFDAAGIGEVLDPIRIAHRDKLLLLSEDMHYRQLAEMGGVTAHAWLQAAALVLKAARRISVFDYATLVARLAFQRHDFVTVDSDTLLLGREGDDDDQAFNVAARSIGGPKADLASHAGVVIGFACGVWSSPVASWRKGRAISRLLDNLIKGRGAHAVGIIAAVEARLRNTRPSITDRSDLAREHVAGWRQGHFLDSRAHDRAPRGRKPRR